jgi:hypothetical protein
METAFARFCRWRANSLARAQLDLIHDLDWGMLQGAFQKAGVIGLAASYGMMATLWILVSGYRPCIPLF